MGIESYSFLIVSNQVEFKIENSFWKLQGLSSIKTDEIYKFLKSICTKKKNVFIYKKIINIYVIEENNLFQGFEIKGCLSCFKRGIDECFDLYQKINNKIGVDVIISNKKEIINDKKTFSERMYSENKDKIDFFQKQYGEKEIYKSIKNFYK